jgi:hypothetical protein
MGIEMTTLVTISDEFIDRLILAICEMPDRNSPEEYPECMAVTPAELRQYIRGTEERFADSGESILASRPGDPATVGELIARLRQGDADAQIAADLLETRAPVSDAPPVSAGHSMAQRLREVASFLRSARGDLEADAAVDCDRAASWIEDSLASPVPDVRPQGKYAMSKEQPQYDPAPQYSYGPQGVIMTNADKMPPYRTTLELPDEQIRFRFFKNLNDAQRLAVFKAFGVYPDNCNESLNHIIERRLLDAILKRKPAAPSASSVHDSDCARTNKQ